VVVDSGSEDDTLQIAEAHSCRIFHRKLDGFGAQKDFAVKQATQDWVVVIDSDEVVSRSLEREIRNLFKRPGLTPGAYRIPVLTYFLGTPLLHCGLDRKGPVRLFHRSVARFNSARVHESVVSDVAVSQLTEVLDHHSYLTFDDYFRKFNLYTTEGANELARAGARSQRFRIYGAFPVNFLKFYIFKLGFLDRRAGFLWSLFSALYPVVKYAKLAECSALLRAPLSAHSELTREA
jgi:glycosyltransferase involved in cell wall biosynthesis